MTTNCTAGGYDASAANDSGIPISDCFQAQEPTARTQGQAASTWVPREREEVSGRRTLHERGGVEPMCEGERECEEECPYGHGHVYQ